MHDEKKTNVGDSHNLLRRKATHCFLIKLLLVTFKNKIILKQGR
jgi:hypothetical protein